MPSAARGSGPRCARGRARSPACAARPAAARRPARRRARASASAVPTRSSTGASLRQRQAREHSGLRRHRADGHGAATGRQRTEAEGDAEPHGGAVHAPTPASWLTSPSDGDGGRDAEGARREQDAHLDDERLEHREREADGREAERQQREREPRGRPDAGRNTVTASAATSQCRAAAAHCRYARSRPAYSSSGPSWIIVSSRCVSGLSNGWRPTSATATRREGERGERQRRATPTRSSPAVAATMPARSVVAAATATTAQRQQQHDLDEDGHREVAARALQREAVRAVPGGEGDGEPCRPPAARRGRSASCPRPQSGAAAETGTTASSTSRLAATTAGARR